MLRENATVERRAPLEQASEFEAFAVEVHRNDEGAVVQPRGELDLATIGMLDAAVDLALTDILRSAPDGTERHARLVLDLRGLSFIDSTGLRALLALDRRAQHDGFQLTMYAPGAPAYRAIQVCGLDKLLSFAAPAEVSGSNGNA